MRQTLMNEVDFDEKNHVGDVSRDGLVQMDADERCLSKIGDKLDGWTSPEPRFQLSGSIGHKLFISSSMSSDLAWIYGTACQLCQGSNYKFQASV